ncbi:uncharacterized protein LOC144432160 [Styela clava]
MELVKIIFFISLICGFLAEIKLPTGSCVSKIVNGKLVQVGDCEKNDGSDIVRLIKKSHDDKKKAECDAKDKCGVRYHSKCYRAVVFTKNNITFNDARKICKSMKIGNPANIYDLAHDKLLLSYLRSLIPSGQTWIAAWTGMKYKYNQLLLFNGNSITIATEVWFPGDPKSGSSNTNIILGVNEDPKNKDQGTSNVPSSWPFHGVICEI